MNFEGFFFDKKRSKLTLTSLVRRWLTSLWCDAGFASYSTIVASVKLKQALVFRQLLWCPKQGLNLHDLAITST